MIPQGTVAGLLFATSVGHSRGLLDARRQDRDGTLGWDAFDMRDGQRFSRWVRKFGQTDELRLDLVPRGPGRDRPVVHALWVDSGPLRLLERFRPQANIIATHSEGAFALWQLSTPMRAASALDLLGGLAEVLDGDRRAVSLEYRARVPGTVEPHSGSAVTAVSVDLAAHSPESLLRAVSGHRSAA